MPEFFISYKTGGDDQEFVDKHLLPFLKEKKIDHWLDRERLTTGDIWNNEIDVAIENAPAILLVISERSMKSQFVTYEWCYAMFKNVKIIPILLQPLTHIEEQAGKEVVDYKIHNKLDLRQLCFFTDKEKYPWDTLHKGIQKTLDEFTPPFSETIKAKFQILYTGSSQEGMKTLSSIRHEIGDYLPREAIQAFRYICKSPDFITEVKIYSAIYLGQLTEYRRDDYVLQHIDTMIEGWSSGGPYPNFKVEIDAATKFKAEKAIPKLFNMLTFYFKDFISRTSSKELQHILTALDLFHTDDIREKLIRIQDGNEWIPLIRSQEYPNLMHRQQILDNWDNQPVP